MRQRAGGCHPSFEGAHGETSQRGEVLAELAAVPPASATRNGIRSGGRSRLAPSCRVCGHLSFRRREESCAASAHSVEGPGTACCLVWAVKARFYEFRGSRPTLLRVAIHSDAAPRALGYRPWLDGVRAIAVATVVFQHTMGLMPVNPGSMGVALFFGLSGYLITTLLLDEERARGVVSLSRFYLRRAARLIPALVVVVIVCNTLFVIAGDHGPLRGSLTALTYTSNYAEVWRGDFVLGYGPTWTLAVEEHFYVLWPLALLWVTRRHGLRIALWTTLGVCAFAFLWRGGLAVLHVRPSLLAIGSLERSDALLYGCAAAMAVHLGWRPGRLVFWAGVAGVIANPVVFHDDTYTALVLGNALLGLAVAATVVGLDYSAPRWVRRGMSLRPLVLVGVLSYGIYLWHGTVMRIAADFGYSGREWRAVTVCFSLAAAAVSYRLVEAPIRSWTRNRTGRRPAETVGVAPAEPAVAASSI
jgi:peptidoglycan/LPS O-acetylase OafA/YrhL